MILTEIKGKEVKNHPDKLIRTPTPELPENIICFPMLFRSDPYTIIRDNLIQCMVNGCGESRIPDIKV